MTIDQDLFRALVNCLDYMRVERGGHAHSADGCVTCTGCCIVAEGERAVDYKAKLRDRGET